MKTIMLILLVSLVAAPVFGSPAYSLDGLLVRAKFVCIAEVSTFDGTTVTLKVKSELRGKLGTNSLSFPVVTRLGKPEIGKRYFVFSQGHDYWGSPKNEIKLSQGLKGQKSYCGWLMLPIQTEKGVELVKGAFSAKFRKPKEGIGPVTLDQARQLVKQARFKGEEAPKP